MILHLDRCPGCALVEDGAKVDLRRAESHCVDREAAQDAELDGQNLVCAGDLDWDPHRELFELVLWCLFIVLLDKVFVAGGENRSIRSELEPYLELASALDVAESWVELQVRLEILGEEELDLHRVLGPVVQDDPLPVELLVHEHIQIVFFLLDVDGYIDALTAD